VPSKTVFNKLLLFSFNSYSLLGAAVAVTRPRLQNPIYATDGK